MLQKGHIKLNSSFEKMLIKVWCCLVLAVLVKGQIPNYEPLDFNRVIAVTPMGTISGRKMTSRRGRSFDAYRGIWYAKPPVGEYRFKPPQPIDRYTAEVDATQDGPACPFPLPVDYYFSEDCLRLNVYTPFTNTSRKMPVIFYIHTGRFIWESGRSEMAGPHYLMDMDIVLVTFNYRIGALGFLSTGDAASPGNYGMKDQVAALKWVRRNIASFGGNPKLITIAGCDAGAVSVALHMVSPMSKGLFHRAISMSGSPLGPSPMPTAQLDLAQKQAELLNCPNTKTSRGIIECLKLKTWMDIMNSLLGFIEFNYHPVALFQPVVEPDVGQERFLTMDPVQAIREGKLHSVPYIISQTTDEVSWLASVIKNKTIRELYNSDWIKMASLAFMLPKKDIAEKAEKLRILYKIQRQSTHNGTIDINVKNLGYLYSDAIVGFPVSRLAKLMTAFSKERVFFYEFAYRGQHCHDMDPSREAYATSVNHYDDTIYLFSLPYRFTPIPKKGPDSDMVDKMITIWYNFAKDGDPNPSREFDWQPMKIDDRKYLRIGKKISTEINLNEDRYKIWEELYPLDFEIADTSHRLGYKKMNPRYWF